MQPALRLLVLGAVIGSNNLAASLTLGAFGAKRRRLRIVGVFGASEFLLPLAGIWLGRRTATYLGAKAEWVGPVLLAAMGCWVLWSTRARPLEGARLVKRVTTWTGLLLLSLALSLDNLIVGFTLGLAGTEPLVLAATIAAFSIAFSWLGLTMGDAARAHWAQPTKYLAGVLLIALAIAGWAGWL